MTNKFHIITILLFTALCLLAFANGCKKTDHPLGLNAPNGFDFPTHTPTPGTGAFNCYVYDGGAKQGVTIVLLDPTLTTPLTTTTNQYGNAIFDPSPLEIGTYTAKVIPQGRYGLSSLPVIVTSQAQGPVSVQFWAGNQALTLVSGAPVSYSTGTGAYNFGVSYVQPGTLDVPITVTSNTLQSSFNSVPATFVLDASSNTETVKVSKTACAVMNQPITWIGFDFLGSPVASVLTTIVRNYPVNVLLSETIPSPPCNHGIQSNTWICTLNSSSDCNTTWTISAKPEYWNTSYSFNISNGQSVTFAGTSPCGDTLSGIAVTISSPIGTAIGSGTGTIINATF